uniref:cytochrome c oxidase subunit II n=1 Tax=Polypodium hydriforme TaxID=43186 RepID=UPI002115470A
MGVPRFREYGVSRVLVLKIRSIGWEMRFLDTSSVGREESRVLFQLRLRLPYSLIRVIYKEEVVFEVFWSVFPLMMLVYFTNFSSISHFFERCYLRADLNYLQVWGKQWDWSSQLCRSYGEDSFYFPLIGESYKGDIYNLMIGSSGKVQGVSFKSLDVLHSFFMSSGFKVDVLPHSRLNMLDTGSMGVVEFNCSELCGRYHSYMGGSVFFVLDDSLDVMVMSGYILKYIW